MESAIEISILPAASTSWLAHKTPISIPAVSVIIPVVNEAEYLPTLLDDLKAQQGISLELIVSDGGSTDGSETLATAAGAILVHTPKGRGVQMNAGAQHARGDYLLFLHADSRLNDRTLLKQALGALNAAIAEQGHQRIAGHFSLRFRRQQSGQNLSYRYMEEKTALNRPYTTNGDQGLLISKGFFQELGGFDESLAFLEDQRLAEKIRQRGLWITLPGVLQTSARRFETEGWGKRYFLMAIIMGMYYADIREFFQCAPQVYRTQNETERLLVTPFLRLIWRLWRQRGIKQCGRDWLQLSRFVGQNIWQMFFFLDVLARSWLGPKRYPCTVIFDRLVQYWPRWRIWNAIFAVLVFIVVVFVIQPCLRLAENKALK